MHYSEESDYRYYHIALLVVILVLIILFVLMLYSLSHLQSLVGSAEAAGFQRVFCFALPSLQQRPEGAEVDLHD